MTRYRVALQCVFLVNSGALAACSANPDRVGVGVGTDTGAKGGGGSSDTGAQPDLGGTVGMIDMPDIGPIGGGTNDPAALATAIVFDPPAITLVIDSATAKKTAEYSLVASLKGGGTQKVTPESLEFDRPDLAAQMNGSPVVLTATGAVAGKGKLHAVYGEYEATADLDVQLVEKHVEGAVPDDVVTALDGGAASPPQDPTVTSLLYPYDKTVFALGLQSPEIMWTAAVATPEYYRLHAEQAGYAYDLYQAVTPPAPPVLPVPPALPPPPAGRMRIEQDAWDRITSSNGGDPLVITLFRYDGTGKKAYSVASASLTIAHESLRGAIYYWTASRQNAGVGNITRIYPGVGAVPESLGTGKCMGCHSVSADGTTMVADLEGVPTAAPYQKGYGDTRAWASFDLPASTLAIQTDKYGAGPALTPDGKYVVFGNASGDPKAKPTPIPPAIGSKNFSLAVTRTGVVVPDSGLDDIVFGGPMLNLMMPSFSLDGKKLAAVEAGGNLVENVIPNPASRIVYMDFDPAGPKFDPTLHEVANISQFAAGNQGFGYPAFTPDNNFVAYHTGLYSTGCNPGGCGDETPDGGEIWVSPVGGGTPIRLTTLNDPPAAKDHGAGREPMFCPVKRGGYSWMVFTSMRDWGNELVGAAPNTNAKRRLWVAAIDGDIKTTDPSHPAFYLEGQENTPNMRGFWALSQCIQTPPPGDKGTMCKANFECCSGFCVEGVCVDKTTDLCVGIGGACTATGDCCNAAVVDCRNNLCKVLPPVK